MDQVFYRIVPRNPPTWADFLSYEAQGMAPPSDPRLRRMWQGVSVYDAEVRARRQAEKLPRLGGYIAELHVPDDGMIQVQRTGTRRGHYTLWGDAAELLACVAAVRPV